MKKQVCVTLVLALVTAMGFATIAGAEDDYKSFGVRLRAIYVKPNESTDFKAAPVSISDDIVPELDLEYFLMKNVSAELIAAVSRHDIKVGGKFAGSTWLLPPTVTVKYHPFAGNTVSPYIGFGANFIFPFNSKLSGADPGFSIDNSIGWAAQAGIDFKIKDNMYFNIDYKYLSIETSMKIAGKSYDLNLDPHLFGIGVGYRF